MATRSHAHEEVFPASPARVFSLLHTPNAIRGWRDTFAGIRKYLTDSVR